jgi:hypothetical protein
MDEKTMKRMQLRALHNTFKVLKEEELDALAQFHAEEPGLLKYRYGKDADLVSSFDLDDEAFHGGNRTPLPDPPTETEDIANGNDFASALELTRDSILAVDEDVTFRYLDREIFPLRTTRQDGPRPGRIALDLLLATRDNLPVVGELKVRRDRPAYPALIQALRYAVELSSPRQLNRIAVNYEGIIIPDEGPQMEILLLGVPFDEPAHWKSMFDATKTISSHLMDGGSIAQSIRRISYVDASLESGQLKFTTRFSFKSKDAE